MSKQKRAVFMLINEVSKITGFSKDTIRYYEKIGLIELDKNNSNYRHFGEREIEKLRQIGLLKGFGFTLKEIGYLLNLGSSDLVKCDSVSELVDEKVSVIEEKIDKLNEIRSRLMTARKSCAGDCAEFVC